MVCGSGRSSESLGIPCIIDDAEGNTGGGATAAFVNYASQDAAVANAIVAACESGGLRCWIAPRDVAPGAFYADEIVGALNASGVLVLVLTANACASAHVLREVERASSKRHPVVTLRVEAVLLPAGLEYFLSASHWLDATASGVEGALPNLVAEVLRPMRPAAANVDPMSLLSLAAERWKTRRSNSLLVVAGTVLLLGLALIAADKWWLPAFTKSREPAAAVIPEKSIAVLPFIDMSAKHDQEYFSDGLSEEQIDLLARIPGLHVPARTSSFYFKGRQATIGDIARTLGVAQVLEGSVRKSGKTTRITAQLIRADSGYHVWSQTFDRPLGEAVRYGQEAISRHPLNAWHYYPVARAQGLAGKFVEAEATYRRAIEFNPTPTPAGLHALHANSLLALHRPAAALEENAREGDDQFRQMNWPLTYDALGRKTDAEREIAVFERIFGERDPLTVAEFYACRKDADHAIPWLERSSEEPGPTIDAPNRLACLKNIESDARYTALLLKWRQTANPGA